MEQVSVIDGTKFFEFDKVKVQDITFDQLRNTVKENDPLGEPLKGMYHFDVIQEVLDTAKDLGYKTEVYDLFAAQNKNGGTPGVSVIPRIEAQVGKGAVEAHLLRRVFANVRILNFDTEEYTTNLSIAYHQRGIQVGFGNNVKICHNQCMLNADLYAATYKDYKGTTSYELRELLELVKGWLSNAREHIEADREMIEKMKQIEISAEQMFRIIGMLTAQRVAHDTTRKEIKNGDTYPLNQSQICDVTEQAMLAFKENGGITCWDLYNFGTNLYKAKTMDIPAIMPQNRSYVQFLRKNLYF